MLESKIQSKILKELKQIDECYAHKNITTNRKGIPDIIVCYKGRYVALEIKREGGKPTELQKWNIEQIRKSGGIAEIVYSFADVAKILRIIDEQI